MLYKLIETAAFYNQDEPTVQIIDLEGTKGLIKSASADKRIVDFASTIKPEDGKIFVHILAMTAGEYYGSNRNGDYFPMDNLIKYHHTFVSSPAHIFRNHINKDPSIAIGQVVYSVYNERMHRVEVIAWIDKNKGSDIVARLGQGDFPATSMACRTPYDTCSICGNQARTRQQYCKHLADEMGMFYPDGKKVFAVNDAPLTFFDMSIVVRPADPVSSVLQKLASDPSPVSRSSAELGQEANLEDIYEKNAGLSKLSDFIKEIPDGHAVDLDENLDRLVSKVQDPSNNVIPVIKHYRLNETLSTFAHLGISPSITFLAELIGQKLLGDEGVGIGKMVAAYMDKVGAMNLPVASKSFGDVTGPNVAIVNSLVPYIEDSSLAPEYVEKRAAAEWRPGTNIGYAGNGPFVEPTEYEHFRKVNLEPNKDSKAGLSKMISTLMAIGGAALAAKWYITSVMERRYNEAKLRADFNPPQNGVKILVVKSASDIGLTYKLAKAAMLKVFQNKKD